MDSTMQDFPLTISAIMRHGCGVHGARTVTTAMADGYRHTTYRELGQQAAQLANGLHGLGVTGDQRVATFMWNNAEHLAIYLAAPSMGAVLHTLNIRLFPEQIAYVAKEAEDQVVLVDMSLAKLLAPVLPELETVHTVIAVGDGDTAPLQESGKTVLRYAELLEGQPTEFDWPRIDENSAAAMCYTSGTTGNPKGVVYSHRSSFLHAMATCSTNGMGVGACDRVLPIVPMFHANAWGLPYAAVMAGAELVLPDCNLDARSVIGMIEKLRPTLAGAVPTIWNDVMHYLEKDPDHDISSLRLVACGGSAVPVSMMRTFEDKYNVQIRQLWGMTETSPLATLAWPPVGTPQDRHWAIRGTQGQPICGVEMRIVSDDGTVLPNDGQAVGEVEVRGPWITGSYYRGHDDSKFDSGWLRTGDVGRIDEEGFVTLTDRAKDVIKSGGEWISSVELENCLVGHPDVLEAAVVGVPDERWQERPLAVVVLNEGASVSAGELRTFLSDKVVRWWLPERWAFADEVPRTSVGKYDKKAIRSRYADNAYEVTEARD
ncbi:long-chain fatty acid--CoA ligase [Mycobacterium montefiorense]|uniref:Long-chain-fatty-acid--CoA ligase FadD13 n=1 Tax=Mycobacterium montefiorense TaxID=154654 RepID=A0AA37PSS4_9MYCO|nr:long-chain fatty acid--CoA ligase [Mycobacterium montefiorense]GBG39371.1 long-chain-fatty-acid--CoA ligase [Mycobacterium montefiorense]GKU37893.1 long-chain-fatty-acid--CoA ligase [Mycobacterium montefiorense]GKU42287.1 long-chain-fatty-acid--CoA ligase [Mycobacterium montefiorense]GKU44219.1 long-chain-fatty-acid--CoA ligase [Mycobacterium montefiorense]GKU53212.1 long-chain-fatty-acid--CoA ligase [Mycobacterium montefiorense]